MDSKSLPIELFSIPLCDRFLIYAPLHGLAAVVDASARQLILQCLRGESHPTPALEPLLKALQDTHPTPPVPRQGAISNPYFLGLVTTRGCNMGCVYCDFVAPKLSSPVMSISMARQAVDAYLDIVQKEGLSTVEVHFFGGEPFAALQTVQFVVEYTRFKADQLGLLPRFEAITNGLFNRRVCQWIADTFDTIVLSLDGPQEVHDRYRPALNGKSTFPIVANTAHQLAQSDIELVLRACITSETVNRMPEISTWFAAEFAPQSVCFEALIPSGLSAQAGLLPPEPWDFALNFLQADAILKQQGSQAVLSTAATLDCWLSFCPLGKDAIIITPEGNVNACYLLEEDWRRERLELCYGHLDSNSLRFQVNQAALEAIRHLNVSQYPLCQDCFCRYHCAGGCHVKRQAALHGSKYDETCIQTRIVTLGALLDTLGQEALKQAWLADRNALECAILQQNDRLE